MEETGNITLAEMQYHTFFGSDVKPKTSSMDEISATLAERGNRYGSFEIHAEYAERINNVYEQSPNWRTMNSDCKESLRIIANKIGRILNGDPEYDDNWRDIAGYAKLILDRINKNV
jgi:hypothetical protein